MRKVKLFKHIDGELRLVDYGIESMAAVYVKRGYFVEFGKADDHERVWWFLLNCAWSIPQKLKKKMNETFIEFFMYTPIIFKQQSDLNLFKKKITDDIYRPFSAATVIQNIE